MQKKISIWVLLSFMFNIGMSYCALAIEATNNTQVQNVDKSKKITVQKGTIIKLELIETLSSQNNKTGDIVHYNVVNDIKAGDTVVIQSGAEALGQVTLARAAKGWGKGGNLEISVETVKAINGTNVLLAASMGEGKSWNAGKTIIGTALLGLAFGGGMKGKKVTIPKGTTIDVFIAEDTTIDVSKNVNVIQPTSEGSGNKDSSVCLKSCENVSGQDFKKCMESCNECIGVCSGVSNDDYNTCLNKCNQK